MDDYEEKKYWSKKRKHQLKNHVVRGNWKRFCSEYGVGDYESEWDDSLSYHENINAITLRILY